MDGVGRPALLLSFAVALFFAGTTSASSADAGAPARMKAVVYHEFGGPDVLRVEDVDKPAPADDEVLVRVHAASVNPLDWHTMEGKPYIARLFAFGLLRPKDTRMGVDYAGTVEAVGRKVTTLKPGDEVFGARNGALAEYVVVRADRAVVPKPANVTFEQAAAVPVAALTALQAVRDAGQVRAGQKVLINGASGGVGTFAVQIAASLGADVTGVCSTKNLELVRSLGAGHVVDYTKQDFTRLADRYDVIVDNVGNLALSDVRRVLAPEGRFVLIGGGGVNDRPWIGPFVRIAKTSLLSRVVDQDMAMMMARIDRKDLAVLREMLEARKITPVIDRRYPLAQVREAMRYLEAGHARGKVIVDLDEPGEASPAGTAPSVDRARRLGPGVVALALVGVPAAVIIVPIVAALALDRRFRRRHPGRRPYRWGYYFSIMAAIGGVVLGAAFESGVAFTIACGVIYVVLAWLFARRRRWAWIALTVLSLNPVAWIVNAIYLRKRWGEAANGRA